jgi:large subunit ribosomal protein L29
MATAPATVTVKDLRGMSEADLRAQVGKLRQEIWHSRLKLREGAAQQTHQIRQARRQIARILTILKQQTAKSGTERS